MYCAVGLHLQVFSQLCVLRLSVVCAELDNCCSGLLVLRVQSWQIRRRRQYCEHLDQRGGKFRRVLFFTRERKARNLKVGVRNVKRRVRQPLLSSATFIHRQNLQILWHYFGLFTTSLITASYEGFPISYVTNMPLTRTSVSNHGITIKITLYREYLGCQNVHCVFRARCAMSTENFEFYFCRRN